jgi:hypothetical protein
MARVYAQEWITNGRVHKYSLHLHNSDIHAFGNLYNRNQPDINKLNQHKRAWQVTVSEEVYQSVADAGYGKIINGRP